MNCPFCKSPKSDRQSFAHVTDYDCGSSDYGTTQGWSRSDICYQNQLEQYEELLRRAVEIVIELVNNRVYDLEEIGDCHPVWYCPLCNGDEVKNQANFIHTENCPRYKAQALLPELEAVLKEK